MKYIKAFCTTLYRHWRITATAVLFVVAIIAIGLATRLMHRFLSSTEPLAEIVHSERIEQTPEEIRAIHDIGQWEFLSVETEELVEHHEARTFGNRHLVKVFYGTLRIGIDMQRADDDWFKSSGPTTTDVDGRLHYDTALLTLPEISLLDENFIDETRTVTFYEKGTNTAETKQALYTKAAEAMKRRTLSEANLRQAREAAEIQFTRLFEALGYKHVVVTFGEKSNKNQQSTQQP